MTYILLIVGAIIGLSSVHAKAVDYDVRAMVPADPPTQAPQISDPIDGFQAATSGLSLSGACQIMSPAIVVSIWRGGAPIGSTTCTGGGTFFLNIGLTSGINVLVARGSSITGQFGPDGVPISVRYVIPEQPSTSPTLSTFSAVDTVTGSVPLVATPATLHIESQQPFYYYADDGLVTLQLVIKNGESPYELVVDWGDGTIETRMYNAAGVIEISHRYTKSSMYAVRAKITDVKGATTTITLTTVTFSKTIEPIAPTLTKTSMTQIWLYAIGLFVLAAAMLMYLYEHNVAMSTSRHRRRR